ncbi:MAG: hypothetical protein R3E61_01270 [Pseudomonadales bacterium]
MESSLTAPITIVQKLIRVQLAEPLRTDAEKLLCEGVQLDGEKQLTKPAQLFLDDERLQVRLVISEGKYHQVKRMFAAMVIAS